MVTPSAALLRLANVTRWIAFSIREGTCELSQIETLDRSIVSAIGLVECPLAAVDALLRAIDHESPPGPLCADALDALSEALLERLATLAPKEPDA